MIYRETLLNRPTERRMAVTGVTFSTGDRAVTNQGPRKNFSVFPKLPAVPTWYADRTNRQLISTSSDSQLLEPRAN